MTEPQDLDAAVGRVLRRLGAPDPQVLERLEAGWPGALGVAAEHARMVRFAGGELMVEVDHPVWATRVQLSRAALEALAGEPVRLLVRVRR